MATAHSGTLVQRHRGAAAAAAAAAQADSGAAHAEDETYEDDKETKLTLLEEILLLGLKDQEVCEASSGDCSICRYVS